MQAFQADLIVGDCLVMCTQVLASKLDTAVINFSSSGPRDPVHTSVYRNSNQRMFLPIPLPYLPQAYTGIGSQHMVRRPGCTVLTRILSDLMLRALA